MKVANGLKPRNVPAEKAAAARKAKGQSAGEHDAEKCMDEPAAMPVPLLTEIQRADSIASSPSDGWVAKRTAAIAGLEARLPATTDASERRSLRARISGHRAALTKGPALCSEAATKATRTRHRAD
jgi:hypothetical protein